MRERTRACHEVLERTFALASPSAGRAEYARHVAALWGWLHPTESILWRAAWPAAIEAPARAEKASWLAADIATARAWPKRAAAERWMRSHGAAANDAGSSDAR